MSEQSNSKRIAKNTLMLYFRQILIMLVSLYTVRVVLNVLGAEDYGIYNVVAGVVVLFSFVNNAMATSTQRFLNFYLGRNETEKVRETFSSSCIIHLGICIIFLLLAETIGLWFVKCKLNIPDNRHHVVIIVYQLAIISTIFNILRVPYNAVMIAYEKMDFFAYISILEVFLKLGIVFILKVVPIDKLVIYSFLVAFVSFFILIIFKLCCNRKFDVAHFHKINDIELVKEIMTFSGWSLFGATASVCNTQGINLILNIFTNVTVNAAMGIANQVNTAVYSFVSNFQLAFNPQLVKSYAANENDYFEDLLMKASKFSYYLLFIIFIPLYFNVDFVLQMWLKNVPEYSVDFVKLILIWSLIETLNGPLYMAIGATGKIKVYQILIGIINLLNIPFAIIAFILKASPLSVLYIRIGLNVFALIFRLVISKKTFFLSMKKYIKQVLISVGFISVTSYLFTYIVGHFFHEKLSYFFGTCICGSIFNLLFIWVIGLSKNERFMILSKVKGKLKK